MSTNDAPWTLEHGLDLRRQARGALDAAVLLTESSPEQADDTIRRSLALAASAYNWLEGTEFDELAHDEMHKYGRYAREHFPDRCQLEWTGSGYEERCPVAVAHKRLGFSIGFIGDRVCSICQGDPSECIHTPGEFYEVEGGTDESGRCRTCFAEGCNSHVAGATYRVRAVRRITNAEIQEISLVAKPKHPDARLTAVPVDLDALQEYLGPDFKPGMRVSCDQCLKTCPGMDYPFANRGGAHL